MSGSVVHGWHCSFVKISATPKEKHFIKIKTKTNQTHDLSLVKIGREVNKQFLSYTQGHCVLC